MNQQNKGILGTTFSWFFTLLSDVHLENLNKFLQAGSYVCAIVVSCLTAYILLKHKILKKENLKK